MTDWNSKMIDEFRARGGKNIPNFGDRLLLLTVKGAKTGTPRTYPLAYTRDGDKIVVAASKGGAPSHPDWYRNVVANPDVELEIGTERFTAHATPLPQGEERDRLYGRHADVMPGFHDYELKTDRIIPVVVLERVGSPVAA